MPEYQIPYPSLTFDVLRFAELFITLTGLQIAEACDNVDKVPRWTSEHPKSWRGLLTVRTATTELPVER